MPNDFPEMFALLGWEAIEDHYQTNQRAVRRWMRQCGEEELIARRRGYLRKVYASKGKPNIAGRRPRGFPELPAVDPALAFVPVRRLRRPWREDLEDSWELPSIGAPTLGRANEGILA